VYKYIIERALELGYSDAFFAHGSDGTSLLMFCAYGLPDAPPVPGRIALSNYYVASNKGYMLAKQMLGFLKDVGLRAQTHHKHGIKTYAASSSGAIGRNTIFYHPTLGSLVSIHAIDVDIEYGSRTKNFPVDFCGDCNLCAEACPTGAITKGGFERGKCIRNYCNDPFVPPSYGKHIYQLFGCEICQWACPKNKNNCSPARTFDINLVLQEKYTKEIRSLVGANYGRRTKILNQTLFYAANAGYTGALPYIEALLGDDFVGEAARYAYGALSGKNDMQSLLTDVYK